jgi:hypothetical protein
VKKQCGDWVSTPEQEARIAKLRRLSGNMLMREVKWAGIRRRKPETIDLTTDDEEQMGMLVPRNYRWAPLGYRKKHGRI